MKTYHIDSDIEAIQTLTFFKGTSLTNLTKRKVKSFVRNGSDWLVESNGKLFTNVIDCLEPKWGTTIQYSQKYRVQKPFIFERMIYLLKAGKYITQLDADVELEKLKSWKAAMDKERIRDEFVCVAGELGINLTKAQIEKLDQVGKIK